MDLEEASAAVSLKVVRILGEVRNRLKLRMFRLDLLQFPLLGRGEEKRNEVS